MTTKMKLILIVTFGGLLAVAGFIAARAEAKAVGDACEMYRSSECSGEGGACLATENGNYCSISCKTSADCPQNWQCAKVASDTYSAKSGEKTKSDAIRMCVRP